MQKKYIVRLSDEERSALQDVVKKLKGTSQKVKRAQILLKADAEGPGWSDQKIAEAFDCRTQTVEDVRRRLVERGFEETLNGPKRTHKPTPNILDGGTCRGHPKWIDFGQFDSYDSNCQP